VPDSGDGPRTGDADAGPAPWERRPATPGSGVDLPEPGAARPTPWRRVMLVGRVVTAAVAALVFLLTGTAWVGTEILDARLREVAALDPDSTAVTDPDRQLGDQNYLIVGSDTRLGSQPGAGVGTPAAVGGARADVIMITHIPADHSRVVVVSIPRDVQISRPPCEEWNPRTGDYTGETVPGAEIAKINSAYAVGGPKCLTRVVQELSGLEINHFIAIGFQGFKDIVDAVGGVRVCVERALRDAELGVIIPEAGYTTISGSTALDFVRARKVYGDPTGDYGRIQRQQRFLSSLLRELLSTDVLLSPSTLRSVARAIISNTRTDNVDISTLLQLGHSVQGLEPSAVTFVTSPTTGTANRYGNEVLLREETEALFRAIIDGTPLPGTGAEREPGPTTSPTASPTTSPPGSSLPSDLHTVSGAASPCA
jgi:LCP family protein required for cell wall assembly